MSTPSRLLGDQPWVGVLGVGTSILAGLLLGMGQGKAFFLALVGLAVVALVILGIWVIALAPEKIGFWLFGAAILTVPWNGVRLTESVTVADFFILLALPFAAYGIVGKYRTFSLPTWLVLGAGLLAMSVLVMELLPPESLAVQISPPKTYFSFQEATGSNLGLGIRLLIAAALFPMLGVGLVSSWRQVNLLANLWVVGVVISCLVAVLDAFAGTSIQLSLGNADINAGAFGSASYGQLGADVRYVGLSIHPVALSLAASMVMPFIIIRMSVTKKYAIYLPAFIICFGGMLLSGSRTGILLLALTIVILVVWLPETRRVILAGVGILIAVIFALQAGGDSLWPERLSSSGDVAASNEFRSELLSAGIQNVFNSPIRGYGFELVRQAHNVPLQLLLSGGIVACLAYFTIVLGYLREGFRLTKSAPSKARYDMIGLTLGLIVFLAAGLFGNYVFDRYLYVPAALIMGAAYLRYQSGQGSVVESSTSVEGRSIGRVSK